MSLVLDDHIPPSLSGLLGVLLPPRQQIYVDRIWKTKFREDKTSPTIEQLTRTHMRIPVLVYERVKTAQYLHFIRRYRKKLVFAGKLDVIGIVLVGFTGYLYVIGTKYGSFVIEGLLSILATAKLDYSSYHIIDWHQKKGQLLVFVSR
jgi:hypothetical protein